MTEQPLKPPTPEDLKKAFDNLDEISATWGRNPPKHIKAKILENLSVIFGIRIERIFKITKGTPP